MTDTERLKMALPLLQALADGKQLQFRMPNDEWRAMELDCDAVIEQPTSYRIAPDLPPRPSVEDVLNLRTDDGRRVRLTGEYRNWKKGEQFINSKGVVEIAVIEGSNDFPRWIVEPLPDHRTAIPYGMEIDPAHQLKTWKDVDPNYRGEMLQFCGIHGRWIYITATGSIEPTRCKDDPTFILRPIAKPEPRYEPWTLETVPSPFPQIEIRGHITEVEWADDVGVKLRDGWQHTYASLFREGKTRDGLHCGRRVEA